MLNKGLKAFTATVGMVAALAAATPAFAQNAFEDPKASSSAGAVSGPDLAAVTATITGGDVTVAATASVVALFKNSGTAPVTVKGINLYPSSTVGAQVALNKCAEAPLPPEAECAITVNVTGLQLGAWRVEILLDHDGRTRLATAAMTGNVTAGVSTALDNVKAEIEAVPDKIALTSSGGGSSLVGAVLLRNRTSEAVELKGISLEMPAGSGFTSKSACPDQLAPGETCSVSVSWTPTSRGLTQGVMLVKHSAKSSMTQVEVSGNFSPTTVNKAALYPDSLPDAGLLVTDKDTIDFGDGINGASAITLSLVNMGSQSLALKTIKLSGSDSGLSIARTGCRAGTVLKPTDACALTVNWVPSREGDVIDDLQILHTGARGVLVLPVRGGADAAVSRESLAIRQAPEAMPGDEDSAFSDMSDIVQLTPVLDGYVVTSHSPQRAVINGPVGSLVVRDGEDVVIAGVKWTVTITGTGVILTSAADEILLVFDKSLKPVINTTTDSSSSSSNSSSSNSNSDSSSSSSNSSSDSDN